MIYLKKYLLNIIFLNIIILLFSYHKENDAVENPLM